MNFFKMFLFGMLVAISVTACKQAQNETAAAAKEQITEMKANTLDAAKDAAAVAEQAAADINKAAQQAEAGAAEPAAQ